MTTTDRPLHELPPVCPEWIACGWCILDEGHDGSHLPLPVSYPPLPTTVPEVA